MINQMFFTDTCVLYRYAVDLMKALINSIPPIWIQFGYSGSFDRMPQVCANPVVFLKDRFRVKLGNDERGKSISQPFARVATTSPAARSPESLAPCAVEKKFGEVASPAKNNRPSTGAASTARSPAWPGSACE